MEDGAKMWRLVKDTGVLDVNSSYSYLMLCQFFADTCVVAEVDNELVGFVTAFRPPDRPNAIFIWQIAVDSSQRGKGLASKLLHELFNRETNADVHFLEATISPSNKPSINLFTSFARDMETDYEVSGFFPASVFPESGHEEEQLYRIGPM